MAGGHETAAAEAHDHAFLKRGIAAVEKRLTSRLSMASQLLAGFGIALLPILLAIGYTGFVASQASKAMQRAAVTDAMSSSVDQLVQWTTDYSLTQMPESLEKAQTAAKRYSQLSAKYKALNRADSESVAKGERLDKVFAQYLEVSLAMADAYIQFGRVVGNSYTAQFHSLEQDLHTQIGGIKAEQDANVLAAVYRVMVVSLVAGVLIVLVVISAAMVFGRRLAQPLHRLIRVARSIADTGDLDQQIEIERHDEIGELATTFDDMVRYLKEMAGVSEAISRGDLTVKVVPRSQSDTLANAFVRMIDGLRAMVVSVRDIATQVASGSTQVADSSHQSAEISARSSSAIEEVTATMHEMSVNVQSMVRNTQTQASSVSQTSASIHQMVASINRVADNANILLDISKRSHTEAETGVSTMQHTTAGLTRINDSISASAATIVSLGERANEIGKIVQVIDDIAEQSNLLALNAAIEAARAGEHGLGFAVVADEVRKLAEKSAQSTSEIGELVQSIQSETRKAVAMMEQSSAIVTDGMTMGGDLSQALDRIAQVVADVYKLAEEIGSATNEQANGSAQISTATSRLNEITNEISAAADEQSNGAGGVVKAMEKMRELVQAQASGSAELAASAEQMSRMAAHMVDSVGRFTIDTQNADNPTHPTMSHSRLKAASASAGGR